MTEGAPTEPADLVDVSYAPFVRPLGNLVVLFAQAETAWLKLVAILTGCTEEEVQPFLMMTEAKAKQKIMPLAKTSAIGNACPLSFPKIISARIDDAGRTEWA